MMIALSININAKTDIKGEEAIIANHIKTFSKYLNERKDGNIDANQLIEKFYNDPKEFNLDEKDVNKTPNSPNYDIYETISIGNSDITIFKNGTFLIETLESKLENPEIANRAANKHKTISNHWNYKALLGNTLIEHKFSAKFGYNGSKAWYVKGSVNGHAYPHYLMSVESKKIDGWNTAAKSRSARMYVVACQSIQGFKSNYKHTDTRVGVTKTGKAYKSTKVGGGV